MLPFLLLKWSRGHRARSAGQQSHPPSGGAPSPSDLHAGCGGWRAPGPRACLPRGSSAAAGSCSPRRWTGAPHFGSPPGPEVCCSQCLKPRVLGSWPLPTSSRVIGRGPLLPGTGCMTEPTEARQGGRARKRSQRSPGMRPGERPQPTRGRPPGWVPAPRPGTTGRGWVRRPATRAVCPGPALSTGDSRRPAH